MDTPLPGAGSDGEIDALLDDWLASAPAAAVAPADAAPPPASAPSLLEALAIDAGASVMLPDEAGPAPVAQRDRYVVFSVAGAAYALAQTSVVEVERIPRITLVPRVPAWLRGVTSLRGDVLSVVDLRAFLGLEPTSLHTGRLLVVRLADEDFSLGFLVDSVDQIASVAADAIRPPASPLTGALAPYLAGVAHTGDRLAAVLDLDVLLHSADIRRFDDRKPE